MVKELFTKEEFDSLVQSCGDKLLVVDFTASWCGPCKFIAPEFEKLEAEYSGVMFVKVDVDKNAETAEACKISCMPTFQFYKNGTKIVTSSGADAAKLRSLVEEHK